MFGSQRCERLRFGSLRLQDAEQHARVVYQQACHAHQQQKDAVDRQTRQVHVLQQSNAAHQVVNAFSDGAGALLDAIASNRRRFQQPVIGPVGASLWLSDSKCVSASVSGMAVVHRRDVLLCTVAWLALQAVVKLSNCRTCR